MSRRMSNASLSRIETIDTDGGSIVSASSLEWRNLVQPNRQVNFPASEDESTVPGRGCVLTLGSICCERCHNARLACRGSAWSKIKALFMFITTPFYVLLSPLFRARATRRKVTHHGIIYFYILMASTIVFNLWEQKKKGQYNSLSYKFLQYFEASVMVGALIAMIRIAFVRKTDVNWATHQRNLILYFRTGLYLFGASSMVYTALNTYNDFSCSDGLNIFVNIAKFLFIVGQILFLNYYFQAKLPGGGWSIQVSFAHILGTNLSLWIWTLCREVYKPKNTAISKECPPINLNNTEKYFYPLFVEYLLLVASMVYELWMDLNVPEDSKRRFVQHDWVNENYQEDLESGTLGLSSKYGASHPVYLVSSNRRRKFTPSLAFSFVLGLAFSSIFLAFILASTDSSWKNEKWYNNFLIANICFYCSQLIACYVIKVCGQSQPANRKRAWLNLDDILLYFGLAGIVLWEGFHFYGLLFEPERKPLQLVHGMLGLIEDIVQTVILVSVRRLSSRHDTNSRTITNISLFLLATNFTFWIQNSFYVEQHLENPGESRKILKESLDIFGNILNPIIIFFRFHSATCCYQMWVIFSDTVITDS